MLKLLIDTSVWLDLAKDYRNLPLLSMLADLVEGGEVELLVTEVVREEFQRNRARVLASAKASQADVFKRARNAVRQFGGGARKAEVLRELDDVAHKLAIHGEASDQSMQIVEKLLNSSAPIIASVIARQRAANRGLDRRAPFRGSKNSTADAVLVETYGELVEADDDPESRYAFVTANTADFSEAGGDTRLLSEIAEAIDLLWHQVWYNRHLHFMWRIETDEITVVDKMPDDKPYDPAKVTRATFQTARAAGERVAEAYKGKLGPWDDFEWGMINGKLSALRWVLGDEWDFLDT